MPNTPRPGHPQRLTARRTPRDSRVETAQLVLPGLTNTHGTIFGGIMMQWIDIAAGIAAARHAGGAGGDRLDGPAALPRTGATGRGGGAAGAGQLRRQHLDGGRRARHAREPDHLHAQPGHARLPDLRGRRRAGPPAPGPGAAPGDGRGAAPVHRRQAPPDRAAARTARYEERLMAITREVTLLAQEAVLEPAGAPARELIVATGADRIRFLHGLVTGDVAGQAPGRGCHAALLTPKGQVVSEMRIFVRADDVRLVVDAGQAAPVAAALA